MEKKITYIYISVRRIYQNFQEIAKDLLRRIKIYKIKKFDSILSTNEGSIGK
jgi:hypothetical protein